MHLLLGSLPAGVKARLEAVFNPNRGVPHTVNRLYALFADEGTGFQEESRYSSRRVRLPPKQANTLQGPDASLLQAFFKNKALVGISLAFVMILA